MKRNSITAIIDAVIYLSVKADRYTNDFERRTPSESAMVYFKYHKIIRKAAVNEIIRLDSAPVPSHDLAYKPGTVSAFDQITDILANTPGSGYEFLKTYKP